MFQVTGFRQMQEQFENWSRIQNPFIWVIEQVLCPVTIAGMSGECATPCPCIKSDASHDKREATGGTIKPEVGLTFTFWISDPKVIQKVLSRSWLCYPLLDLLQQ